MSKFVCCGSGSIKKAGQPAPVGWEAMKRKQQEESKQTDITQSDPFMTKPSAEDPNHPTFPVRAISDVKPSNDAEDPGAPKNGSETHKKNKKGHGKDDVSKAPPLLLNNEDDDDDDDELPPKTQPKPHPVPTKTGCAGPCFQALTAIFQDVCPGLKSSKKSSTSVSTAAKPQKKGVNASIAVQDQLQGFWADAAGEQHNIDVLTSTIDGYQGDGLTFTFEDGIITIHSDKSHKKEGRLKTGKIVWSDKDVWKKVEGTENWI